MMIEEKESQTYRFLLLKGHGERKTYNNQFCSRLKKRNSGVSLVAFSAFKNLIIEIENDDSTK
jgi:hypothetical protein